MTHNVTEQDRISAQGSASDDRSCGRRQVAPQADRVDAAAPPSFRATGYSGIVTKLPLLSREDRSAVRATAVP